MKPILHIKLPETASHEEFLEIAKDVGKTTKNEYYILISNNIEMQILNGKQLTELTFEEFKKQYLK
jgi:predicted N-acyltransferase